MSVYSDLEERTQLLVQESEHNLWVRTDRLFAGLMIFQFVGGILASLFISPRTWIGLESSTHNHVWSAIVLGALISAPPVFMALRYPGTTATRHVIAACQALTSALWIHLCGGRIEAHFHIFGSLAFLAFYRDWKVLLTASLITAVDHMARGVFWPQSVFGVTTATHWRWLEHAGWVIFEDVFLFYSCVVSREEMRLGGVRQAQLECQNTLIEAEVASRTAELRAEHEERRKVEEKVDRLDAELLQAQKLEAVGQLAAGIAHEINTPTQFVGDNIRFLEGSFSDLLPLLEQSMSLTQAVQSESEELRRLAEELVEAFDQADLDFLKSEIPLGIGQSLDGIDRVRKIVQSMKDFSHPGSKGKASIDLNRAIESTATVASHEWKYVANLELDLDPELPPLVCEPGELNQVVLNILVNAAHAIEECIDKDAGEKGQIKVSTRQDGELIDLRISDNGPGIPEEIRTRIFDPFFTTKGVGRGTGQGLSIAYRVIVEKHGGALHVESEVGQGTTFILKLPLEQAAESVMDSAA